MKSLGWVLPIVLLLGALTPTIPAASAGDGWWSGLDEGEAVSLADVVRGPEAYRHRTLTFYAVFHSAAAEYKYYPRNTAFTEARHINFSAWPDGAPVWEKRAFINDFPFLYLPRTHPQRNALATAKKGTRWEITGRIRDLVRGRPAIEVFSFRETGHRLGWGVVQNVMWGRNYAQGDTREGYQSAARRFRMALQPDLPPVYDIHIRKLLADTLRRLGLDDEAAAYERGENVGTSELPDTRPPPGMRTGPLPEASRPSRGGTATPGRMPAPPGRLPQPGPASGGDFGSPDGGAARRPQPAGVPPSAGLPQPPGAPLPGMSDLPGAPAFGPGAPASAAPRRIDYDTPPAGNLPRLRGAGGRPVPQPTPGALPQPPGRQASGRQAAGSQGSGRQAAPTKPRGSGIPPRRRPRLSGVK